QEVDPGEDLGGPQLRRASATPGPAEIYRGPAVRGAHPGDHPDTARVYRSLPGERQAVLSAGGLQGNRGRTAVFKLAVNNRQLIFSRQQWRLFYFEVLSLRGSFLPGEGAVSAKGREVSRGTI